MGGYAIRRGVDGVITIWMVTLLIFLLLRVTGNPIEILVPPDTLPEDRQRLMSVLWPGQACLAAVLELRQRGIRGELWRVPALG